jgi:hypothetical protein
MQAVELAFDRDWYNTDEVVEHISRRLKLVAKKSKRAA